jgi:hypothetical protein
MIYVRCRIDTMVEEERLREKRREDRANSSNALSSSSLSVSQFATPTRPSSARRRHTKLPVQDMKSVQWTRRLVSRIFEARFHALDVELTSGRQTAAAESDFSSFVFDYLAKNFGLEELVRQTSVDLIAAAQVYALTDREIYLFQEFMSGRLGPLVLVFFLMVRSKVMSGRETRLVVGHRNTQCIPGNAVVRLTHSLLRDFPNELHERCMADFSQSFYNMQTGRWNDVEAQEYLCLLTLHFSQLDASLADGDHAEEHNQMEQSVMMGGYEEQRQAERDRAQGQANHDNAPQQRQREDSSHQASRAGGHVESPRSEDDRPEEVLERLALGDFRGFEMQTYEQGGGVETPDISPEKSTAGNEHFSTNNAYSPDGEVETESGADFL